MNPRVILITGANGGLGFAIATSFLNESAENFVYLGVRARKERVKQLETDYPERCRTIEFDVTLSEQWKRAVDSIITANGRIDVLVNNAGKHEDGLLAMLPSESWNNVLSCNLDSVFHGCQTVLPVMIGQRYGRIVNISSLSAILAPAGQSNYAAAKAGVVALSQSLAKEVARIGITVNAICPGYIDTEALAQLSESDKKAAQNRVPMRRFGKPEEVAAAVRFLASQEASYITGSVLKVDGGIL